MFLLGSGFGVEFLRLSLSLASAPLCLLRSGSPVLRSGRNTCTAGAAAYQRLRRKRIGRLKAVREVRERGFVTGLLLWVVVLLDAGVEVLLDAGVVVLILGSNRDVICLAQ